MFVIYHVFGTKVGCTVDFPGRCHDQGFRPEQYEVIETIPEMHGPRYAGQRERFWQRHYGYREKAPSYVAAITNGQNFEFMSAEEKAAAGRKGGIVAGLLGKTAFQTGAASRSPNHNSQTGALQKLGNVASARSLNKNTLQIVVCPHCKKQGRLVPMKRWHFANCREGPI